MEDMECMCLECGISTYLESSAISIQEESETKFVRNLFCPSCGGVLKLEGKAGDEPFYRVK